MASGRPFGVMMVRGGGGAAAMRGSICPSSVAGDDLRGSAVKTT